MRHALAVGAWTVVWVSLPSSAEHCPSQQEDCGILVLDDGHSPLSPEAAALQVGEYDRP